MTTCERCGSSLAGKRKGARFCSRLCAGRARYAATPPEVAERRNARNRRRYASDPAYKARVVEATRRSRLQREYGLTPEDIRALASSTCAVCNAPPPLHVDHNHSTGAVRGFLCRACNLALGYAKDDSARLLALADYLERDKP